MTTALLDRVTHHCDILETGMILSALSKVNIVLKNTKKKKWEQWGADTWEVLDAV